MRRRIPSRAQYVAIHRSTAEDARVAKRLGLPVEVVECVRRAKTLREAIDDYIPQGTRIRLCTPMESGLAREPCLGECGVAEGADDGGKMFVKWDGGSSLALLASDQFSLA